MLTVSRRVRTERKPRIVALPTSARVLARSEKTEAPSTPMNTHTVTSIMFLT
jgi:hypothetical protein